MDACDKYGKLKMVLEIYEQLEEIKLKPNAAIMNYLLNNLTKNNQSMESVQVLFRRQRGEAVPLSTGASPGAGAIAEPVTLETPVQAKVREQMQRRLNQ